MVSNFTFVLHSMFLSFQIRNTCFLHSCYPGSSSSLDSLLLPSSSSPIKPLFLMRDGPACISSAAVVTGIPPPKDLLWRFTEMPILSSASSENWAFQEKMTMSYYSLFGKSKSTCTVFTFFTSAD